MNKKKGIIPESFEFNVINFNDIEYSRRVNPLRPEYLQTLADAIETATAVVESLKRGVMTVGVVLTSFSPSRLSTSWRPACSISPNTHVRMMTAI